MINFEKFNRKTEHFLQIFTIFFLHIFRVKNMVRVKKLMLNNNLLRKKRK